jgi:hypothetical protein
VAFSVSILSLSLKTFSAYSGSIVVVFNETKL